MGEGSAEGSAKGSAVGSAEGSAGGSNKWPLCEHANKIIKNKGCKQSSPSHPLPLPLSMALAPYSKDGQLFGSTNYYLFQTKIANEQKILPYNERLVE